MRRGTSTRRAGARIAALLAGAIGLGCAGSAAGASAELGEPFALRVGESARIEAVGIEVGVEAVVEDSRCAQGVQCVWEGDAAVRVWLRVGAGAREEALLHTAAREHRTATLGGYALRLVRLDPAPVAGRATRPEDYRALLEIARAPGAPAERPGPPEARGASAADTRWAGGVRAPRAPPPAAWQR